MEQSDTKDGGIVLEDIVMFLQAGLEDFCKCKPNLVKDFLHAGQCCLDFPCCLNDECFGAMVVRNKQYHVRTDAYD